MTHALVALDSAEEAARLRQQEETRAAEFIKLSLRHVSEGTRLFIFKTVQVSARADADPAEQTKDIDTAIRYLHVLRDHLKAAA